MSDLLKMYSNLILIRETQQRTSQAAGMAEKAKTVKNYAAIEEAAEEFEAVFITEMLKPMFENVKPDPTFGGGKGEEVFQGFMIDEYGKAMARNGGIGIAEHVKAELLRIQEEAQK